MIYQHVTTSIADVPRVLEEFGQVWKVHTICYPNETESSRVFILFEREHEHPVYQGYGRYE